MPWRREEGCVVVVGDVDNVARRCVDFVVDSVSLTVCYTHGESKRVGLNVSVATAVQCRGDCI